MTQPIISDRQAIRRELLAAINFGIDYGLPVPEEISFSIEMPHINLDSAADLCGWADWLGYSDTIPATFGQPASHLDDPLKADRWITNIYFDWRGTRICLYALDPITPEQAQHWIDSGAAARHADRIAAEVAAEQATGNPGACPTCGSSDPAELLMTGCGFRCDDPSRWHAKQAD